jgi:hypothetical protein
MAAIGKTRWVVCLALIFGLWGGLASAGWIDTTSPYLSGTSSFFDTNPAHQPPLQGSIQWAVYSPAQTFPFLGFGYTPTAGDYVYVYQVFNTGDIAISNFSVDVIHFAENIGSFSDAGDGLDGSTPIGAALDLPYSASWDFDGIVANTHSCGLAYSSPLPPAIDKGYAVNHGTYVNIYGIASPVPEPATLWLVACGLTVVLVRGWLRRR